MNVCDVCVGLFDMVTLGNRTGAAVAAAAAAAEAAASRAATGLRAMMRRMAARLTSGLTPRGGCVKFIDQKRNDYNDNVNKQQKENIRSRFVRDVAGRETHQVGLYQQESNILSVGRRHAISWENMHEPVHLLRRGFVNTACGVVGDAGCIQHSSYFLLTIFLCGGFGEVVLH